MSETRLYGRLMGHGSHAQVTRGFESALRAAGLLDSVVGLDVLGLNEHDAAPWAKAGKVGALARHGVFTGPLDMLDHLQRAKHEQRWAMVAPNSTWMPERQLKALDAIATDVLVPSAWAASILIPLLSASPQKPLHVQVVPHGVHDGFQRNEVDRERLIAHYEDEQFRVLHCSTSERQRKGTWELLLAWRDLMGNHKLPERSELILVIDYAAQIRLAERMLSANLTPPNVRVLGRLDVGPMQMAELLRRVHVVCQPSRGEAFGLIPLEALACGTPVVLTDCTGHSEYLRSRPAGAFVVPHGPMGPMDDGPGAQAPTVSVEEIAETLLAAYCNWTPASAQSFDAAPQVGVDWSWPRQLRPWMELLQ